MPATAPSRPHCSIAPAAARRPYGDMDAVMKLFAGVSDDGLLVDVDATLGHLADAGFGADRTAIVGFCMGGRVTFLVAARRALGAAVGFYGGGIVESGRLPFPALIDEVPTMKTPWLGLFGDLDTGIPIEQVERLRAALDADAPVDTRSLRYPRCQARLPLRRPPRRLQRRSGRRRLGPHPPMAARPAPGGQAGLTAFWLLPISRRRPDRPRHRWRRCSTRTAGRHCRGRCRPGWSPDRRPRSSTTTTAAGCRTAPP